MVCVPRFRSAALATTATVAFIPCLVLAQADAPHAPDPRSIAAGVWMIPGGIRPGREPDGNTVIFRAPAGLIVMDTGRHVWQRQAILEFARARNAPIVAIINSHWHLDHVSGNPDLKRAWPTAKVYASAAIDKALQGFLPNSVRENQQMLDQSGLPPETADDLRGDIATIENGQALRPDVVVTASKTRVIGGLKLRLSLAPHAATDGDVWVFDPKSRVAAVGDLVTVPAPFLDTACSGGWRTALDAIWATPFKIAIPGHGTPMTRTQFGAWRAAFNALIDCSASARGKTECAADWTRATAGLRGEDARETRQSQGMTEYYVEDVLRKHHGDSAYCTAR